MGQPQSKHYNILNIKRITHLQITHRERGLNNEIRNGANPAPIPIKNNKPKTENHE